MWADGEEHYEQMEIVCQKLENGPVGCLPEAGERPGRFRQPVEVIIRLR